jgi:acyl carrier protein
MTPPAMNRLLGVLADVLRVSRDSLSPTTRADDVPDWDSLRTIYLATALESEFAVSFTPEEIASLISVPDAVALLSAKGIA